MVSSITNRKETAIPPLPEMPEISKKFNINAEIVYAKADTLKFLKTIGDETIQLIITSPPYNIGKEYEQKESIEQYLETQEEVIEQLTRVLAKTGSICWQVGNYVKDGEVFPLDIYYYPIFKKYGLKLRNRIVWHFRHGLHSTYRFSGRYETILWFSKTDDYTFNLDPVRVPAKYPGKKYFKGEKKGEYSCNPLGKNPSDIWEFLEQEWDSLLWDIPNVKSNHPEKTAHPCQFPIELVERCVLALTNEGDIVLDPYAGVGSSLLAGLIHNRKVIGIDKEKTYIDIGKKRIHDLYDGNLRIRPMGKKVYVPNGREAASRPPLNWSGDQESLLNYCKEKGCCYYHENRL